MRSTFASVLALAGCLAFAANATSASSSAATSTVACNNSPALCTRAYNNVTYLGAHDSPFLMDASTGYSSSGNQFYNTTIQLDAGVRLVTAQILRQNSSTDSPWHVCHSSCALLDAGPVVTWLSDINTWLERNPNEVVTILLVNQQSTTVAQLDALFTQSGITQFKYSPPSTTTPLAQWPTLQQMINNGTRLVTFIASLNSGDTPVSGSSTSYLMDEFNFVFENPYQTTSLTNFSCTANRPTSVAGNTPAAISQHLMPLMNHFLYNQLAFGIQTSDTTYIETTNAAAGSANGTATGSLSVSADQCTSQYGRAPSYLLVDFFNVGPAIATVDRLNGVSGVTGRSSVSVAAVAVTSAGQARSVCNLFLLGLSGIALALIV